MSSRKGRQDTTQRIAKAWRALRLLCALCVKQLTEDDTNKL